MQSLSVQAMYIDSTSGKDRTAEFSLQKFLLRDISNKSDILSCI